MSEASRIVNKANARQNVVLRNKNNIDPAILNRSGRNRWSSTTGRSLSESEAVSYVQALLDNGYKDETPNTPTDTEA